MSLVDDIERERRIIRNLKVAGVHEPRDGSPVPRGVSKSNQLQLEQHKKKLNQLIAARREEKRLKQKRDRLREQLRSVNEELARRKSKLKS